MKNTRPLAVGLLGLVIGVLATSLASQWVHNRALEKEVISQTFLATVTAFSALRQIRSGDINSACVEMEREVDLGVLLFITMLTESPQVERAKNYKALLQRIRDYRQKHPRVTDDPAIDALADAALAQVRGDPGR